MIERTKPQNKFSRGRIVVIAGTVKSGKSTIISTWGKPGSVLVLDLEGSMDHIPNQDRIRITSLLPPLKLSGEDWVVVPPIERGHYDPDGNPVATYSFVEALEFIRENWDKLGYDHIAMDTVDDFVEMVNPIIVQELKDEDLKKRNPIWQDNVTINDFEFAVGTARVRERVAEKLTILTDLIRRTGQLLLAAHLESTIRIGSGKDVTPRKKMSGVPDKLADLINGQAEVIIYVSKIQGNKYVASMDGYGEITMGARIPALQGKTYQFGRDGKFTLYNQMMDTLAKANAEDVKPQLPKEEEAPALIIEKAEQAPTEAPEQPQEEQPQLPDAVKQVTRRFAGK